MNTQWRRIPLKRLCFVSAEYGLNLSSDDYKATGIRFVRTTDILDDGSLGESGVYVDEDQVRGCLLKDGDLLLSRSGTVGQCLLYDRKRHGSCSYAAYLVRFSPGPEIDSRFAYYYFKSSEFNLWLETVAVSSTISNVNGQKYASMLVPAPPVEVQHQVVAHLNVETARIDALIDRKQRFIELLLEKRRALITHSVTSGLRSNVPTKDSGLEWYGHVPAVWTITRFPEAIDLREGPGILSPDFRDQGTPLLKVGNLTGDTVTMEGCYFLDPSDVRRKWQRFVLEEGDLLISGSASLGGSSVVTKEAAGSVPYTGVIRLRPLPGKMDRTYARYVLWSKALVEQVRLQSAGVGIKHFGPSHLSRVWVPLPPLDEQKSIASFLNAETANIDALMEKTRHSIDLLREYRVALVSAAVTGQLEIPAVNASVAVA